MPSLHSAKDRFTKFWCDQAKRYKMDGDIDSFQIEMEQILRAVTIAEENKDYVMLVDFVKSVGDFLAGSSWDEYQHLVYLVLENSNLDILEKVKHLTNLVVIEKAQGNYASARKLLENKFSLLLSPAISANDTSELFEVAIQILDLGKQGDNFDKLEPILLEALEHAVCRGDIKHQVDFLIELAS